MSLSKRGILYTYSGKIAYPDGAPSILDIAISLSREGRYAGAGMRWWPVALHSFVVCDLLPKELKFDGLLHDSPEVVTGDTPKPAKTDAIEAFENERLSDIYRNFKIVLPTGLQHAQIKSADTRAKQGEVYTVGTQALQEFYNPCPEAEKRIHYYLDKYNYSDMLESSGRVPIEFMRRFREYKSFLNKDRFII